MGNKKIMKYCMDKYLNECIGNCKDDGVKALLLLQKDIEKNNEHHLRQQDLLLQIIRKQSKPNFGGRWEQTLPGMPF